MKSSTLGVLTELLRRYPCLNICETAINDALEAMMHSFSSGGKLLICGNGGSASDALHIVGELMKAFTLPRHIPEAERLKLRYASIYGEYIGDNLQGALPAISLVNEVGLQTAYSNDIAADLAFAQQVYGYGKNGDVLLGISTSGNSKNVIFACEVAHLKGMKVIGLTGTAEGQMKNICDVLIAVPEIETFKVQELHLPVYHAICLALENEFFGTPVEDGRLLV